MNGLPEPPNRGEPIRAELIRQMLDYMRRITPVAGPNIKVSIGPGGAKIEGTPGGEVQTEALAPWAVRRHVTEGDAAGQWEIWLPPGCMSVGGDCAPLNKPASEKTGHEDDKPGWYALHLDESAGEPTRTETVDGEDGQQVTRAIREYPIVAHGKTSAKEVEADDPDEPARRLLYVSARKTPSANEQASADSGADLESRDLRPYCPGSLRRHAGLLDHPERCGDRGRAGQIFPAHPAAGTVCSQK